jgi:hypothetical protein
MCELDCVATGKVTRGNKKTKRQKARHDAHDDEEEVRRVVWHHASRVSRSAAGTPAGPS